MQLLRTTGEAMTEPMYNYDEESNTLYVSFAPGETATGIALNDHMLLRINKDEHRAIGLTLFDYSVLAQHIDVGPRSFPLTGLAQLSAAPSSSARYPAAPTGV
jgi:uncharacterized protein YuzE